jgi:RNA polymerase sigma-70 factor (ECF subfamily)
MDPSIAPAVGVVPTAPAADDLAALLARASRGDEQAFAEFYDRSCTRVFGLVRRVVRDPAQAEEVTQEVYLAVWRESARYDHARGSALGWILTIAHRRAVDRVRASESARERDGRFATLDDGPAFDVVEEAATAALDSARVRQALSMLTDVQREAITLAYYGGYTYKEVSELLDVPLGTIKTRMRDGLIRLRDTLGVDQRPTTRRTSTRCPAPMRWMPLSRRTRPTSRGTFSPAPRAMRKFDPCESRSRRWRTGRLRYPRNACVRRSWRESPKCAHYLPSFEKGRSMTWRPAGAGGRQCG